jgi:hypothetical protein
MKSWSEKLSGYEFVLWDSNRFDINSSNWVKQAFENKRYAFAADYIRLYAVYNMGGFYLDMDVEVKKNFDDLLDRPYVFGLETPELLGTGFFGAEKGNRFIGQLLDYYKDRDFITGDSSFDMKPLPRVFFEVLKDYKYVLNGDPTRDDIVSVFDFDYFTARDWPYLNYVITQNTYTVHHFAASWMPKTFRMKESVKSVIQKYLGRGTVVFFVDLKKKIVRFLGKSGK